MEYLKASTLLFELKGPFKMFDIKRNKVARPHMHM